jgi:hypothetical protein
VNRTFISTNTFSKAFLSKAWEARNDLLDYEKRGFAQFFYLTICGHAESLLAKIITTRLLFIHTLVHWEELPPMPYENDDVTQTCSLEPVITSIKQIAKSLERETESASLNKLIELHGRTFPQKLKEIVGAKLSADLDALASLRNLFAHGRDLIMDFDIDENFDFKGTLDGNILKHPAQRLHEAGIIKDFDINGQNHHEFHAIFYGDAAMLYFYNAVQSIEEGLRSSTTFLPEKDFHFHSKLPDLKA